MSKKDRFHAAQFTPTKWASAQDKADFAIWLTDFLSDGCPEGRWSMAKYRMLSHMFGFIAHNDVHGFWTARFAGTGQRLGTITQMVEWTCPGDPTWTWSDVELQVRKYLRDNDLVVRYQLEHKKKTEDEERAALARLQAKYPNHRPGGNGTPGVITVEDYQ